LAATFCGVGCEIPAEIDEIEERVLIFDGAILLNHATEDIAGHVADDAGDLGLGVEALGLRLLGRRYVGL
jgi:hypothetical protein